MTFQKYQSPMSGDTFHEVLATLWRPRALAEWPSPQWASGLWLHTDLPWSMCIVAKWARSGLLLTLRCRVSSVCKYKQNTLSPPHRATPPGSNCKRNLGFLKRESSLFMTHETCKYPWPTFSRINTYESLLNGFQDEI